MRTLVNRARALLVNIASMTLFALLLASAPDDTTWYRAELACLALFTNFILAWTEELNFEIHYMCVLGNITTLTVVAALGKLPPDDAFFANVFAGMTALLLVSDRM